jgi:hypothetical protein
MSRATASPLGSPGGPAAQQVTDGQRVVGGGVDGAGDLLGQSDEARGEAAVEAFGALRGRAAGHVEYLREVQAAVGGHRTEPDQVGEERHRGTAVDESVRVPDLAVAVAEGRVGELQRDVGPQQRRREPLAALGEDLLDHACPDEPGQEVVDHDPLVVPGEGDPRPLEDLRLGHPVLAQQVDDTVVRA